MVRQTESDQHASTLLLTLTFFVLAEGDGDR